MILLDAYSIENDQKKAAIYGAAFIFIMFCLIAYRIIIFWNKPDVIKYFEDGLWFVETKSIWGHYNIHDFFEEIDIHEAEATFNKLKDDYARRNKTTTI